MLSTASLIVLWAGSSISAQASDLVTTDQDEVLAYSVSATPGFGTSKSLMAGKDDSDSSAKTPLHVLGLAGLRNGESIATVKFDQPQNLHDFWRLKYQIASTTPIANVSVAIELVSEDSNFEGTTHWRQREQFQLPLSELSEDFLEIDSRIHVKEFERRPDEFNNGSLLELVEVTAVNIVLIAKGEVDEFVDVQIDGIEFHDRSPYADLQTELAETVIAPVKPDVISDFSVGEKSRLGVYINDSNSSWLGFVAALKNIGIPLKTHTNLADALEHKTVVVYPKVSSDNLTADDAEKLKDYVKSGGTLIGMQVSDVLFDVFGLRGSENIAYDSTIRDIKFDTEGFPALTGKLDHEFEKRISIYRRLSEDSGVLFTSEGQDTYDRLDPNDSGDGEIFGYEALDAEVLAIYDNDVDGDETGSEKAALTRHQYGKGVAYSFAWDVGYQGVLGQSLEYAPLGRFYSDGYSPGFDVTMNLFKDIFHKEDDTAVSLWTVPDNRDMSFVTTHDIDAHESSQYSKDFALLEQECKVKATYFWQTRYMNDARDLRFLSNDAINTMDAILEHPIGHEIASHSVSHSFTFSRFPIGGNEQFPEYQPRSLFVDNHAELPEHQKYEVSDGTVMGEMKISKYLLEQLTGESVTSFRPGHLAYPIRMNESAEAVGYKVTSTTTAPYSSSHLPYRMSYLRSTGSIMRKRQEQLLDVVEIPLSWEDVGKTTIRKPEDELNPDLLGMAEPEFLEQTKQFLVQLSQYGGTFNLLIHPTELGHKQKLAYEFQVFDWFFKGNDLGHVAANFTTIGELGSWWLARSQVGVDVIEHSEEPTLQINTGGAIEGLTIRIPSHWRLKEQDSNLKLDDGFLIVHSLKANAALTVSFLQ